MNTNHETQCNLRHGRGWDKEWLEVLLADTSNGGDDE